ncbi:MULTISPECIES: response regulator transcription factor [Xanthomonas]|uniref:DNA-binding response regulator n=1 Tax=Xanthomonas phaseoli pv. dieffenbachiae TaxID=92828 RepID=A0A1V9HC31_9XANT|nr:response regulator [Xanthomonas phaseoli]MBO9768620.1 response regulator transcription factor [Xanthomonas phaseoli pv. dieffenbachiae]MBO9776462.1 response regulator transcription factor [Xanthomonas phaseoli pv. dieffenbachiae]MBO9781552.1 response regulator transcription factor [Xanthomonas phaseoli pv. dieffenbachiae]MBO9789924.1 response regulator transcription factor [Xanthomonas phaseoli pv. dieffenbachiae]MBO9794682.1 response regulator transcription factor [Xanthomonas phaseoli pv.
MSDLAPVVYLIDDDASMRAALEDLFASVGLQVYAFGSTDQFLAHRLHEVPACLVLDIRMPGQSGMEFHRRMVESGVALPTIFITGHGDIAMSVEAMKNGAIEFLTKPFRDQALLDAIQDGIRRDRARRQSEAVAAALRARWESLTSGEQDVTRLVVQGLLNKQIAARLHLSEITVKVRRGQAMRKMQAGSLAELVRLAERIGL